MLISVISTGVASILLIGWILSSDQWPAVQKQFFSYEDMKASWPRVSRGFLLNMRVWIIAEFAILVVAMLIAIARSVPGPFAAPIRFFAVAFIDLIRGIPSLLLLLLLGFGVPALQLSGLPNSAMFWGSVALIASYAAYTAEVYRSGMEAVHDSQRAAAKALGLSHAQTLRYAVVPQAIRNVAPALMNGAISLQKDVALLSTLGIRDALREANIYKDRTYNYSSLIVAAALFLAASVPLARLTDWYTKRDQKRRLQRTL